MAASRKAFQCIIERCLLGLRIKYLYSTINRAEALFNAEIRLIRKLGFEDALVQIVEFGDQLRRGKVAFHMGGSGGSSIVLFLLGISEVDPVRHDTYFHRLWLTTSGEPPILTFSVIALGKLNWHNVPRPGYVSVHPMTEPQAIPVRLEPRIHRVCLSKTDEQTFEFLQMGETDGIFQLDSENTRGLLAQVQPRSIGDLACVTALHQISNTHPEVVTEYLETRRTLTRENRKSSSDVGRNLPFLFQETIMGLLRKEAGLPWEETCRFVQTAAKAKMTEQHELWMPFLRRLEQRLGAKGEALFRKSETSSRWAVCRAHHVANAVTSYKAAYFRTHHRKVFERTQKMIMTAEQGV